MSTCVSSNQIHKTTRIKRKHYAQGMSSGTWYSNGADAAVGSGISSLSNFKMRFRPTAKTSQSNQALQTLTIRLSTHLQTTLDNPHNDFHPITCYILVLTSVPLHKQPQQWFRKLPNTAGARTTQLRNTNITSLFACKFDARQA